MSNKEALSKSLTTLQDLMTLPDNKVVFETMRGFVLTRESDEFTVKDVAGQETSLTRSVLVENNIDPNKMGKSLNGWLVSIAQKFGLFGEEVVNADLSPEEEAKKSKTCFHLRYNKLKTRTTS